jgi:hypothetical protein
MLQSSFFYPDRKGWLFCTGRQLRMVRIWWCSLPGARRGIRVEVVGNFLWGPDF